MPIKRILVPLLGLTNDEIGLSMAMTVAKTFDAQVEGLFVRPDPGEALPYLGEGVSGPVIEDIINSANQAADSAARTSREQFTKAAEAAGVSVVDTVRGGIGRAAAIFQDYTGRQAEVVAVESRLSDLIIFGAASEKGPALPDAFEAALISAGRPVLLAPVKWAGPLAKHIAVGWDASAEAAHAIVGAMPFLRLAEKVEVLHVGDEELDPTPADELSDYLALHGIDSTEHLVDPSGRPVGEVLLEKAEEAGADMLIMGGYGHSRLRELILGGVTRHITAHANLPVLMAH